jgi:hypothetical protein
MCMYWLQGWTPETILQHVQGAIWASDLDQVLAGKRYIGCSVCGQATGFEHTQARSAG